MKKLLVSAAVLLSFSLPAFAWNATGHETVAAIAWDTMKPATRAKVSKILAAAQPGDCLREMKTGSARTYFMRAATWPDVVRPKDKEDERECTQFHHASWHFLDHYFSGTSGATGADAPRDRDDVHLAKVNAVERLEHLDPIVACSGGCSVSAPTRARDLAWILHLVGDIHQPLHNTGRVTDAPKEDKGDQGGNLFAFVDVKTLQPGEKIEGAKNLHSLWDNIVDESLKRGPHESTDQLASRAAAKIEKDHPRASLTSRIDTDHFADWSMQGFETAKAIAYPASLHRMEQPSEEYFRTVWKASDEAIAVAGYRLAALLDDMLK